MFIKTVNKELFAAMDILEKEKGISKNILFEALEIALVSAYKRNFQASSNVRVVVDRDTGEIKVFAMLTVADKVENSYQQVELYEARIYQPRCKVGDELELEVTPKEFGRIAAQTAKQVVVQRIREAEREIIYDSYADRVEDIVIGLVQRFEQRNIIIDLGKVEAILPAEEQIPRERYRQGERIKAFIKEVKKTSKGPQVIVSRAHSGFLKRLFEVEVPEIYEGIVEIKAATREPGQRSKIAVWSKNKDIDPVGACVGPRGGRVQAISNELKSEKIDIIKWSEDTEQYIAAALSPAKVAAVELRKEEKRATVIVPDNQLSLAIGKEGQNARLSAKLTGWKIDINSETQIAQERLSALGLGPVVVKPRLNPEMAPDLSEDAGLAEQTMDKHKTRPDILRQDLKLPGREQAADELKTT
ncbi:MAG: transcription termination/antitermination protein NusA [Dethiobacter sp.]|nr:transcription termination/antitermination protein NusA [Dethiobacter sp.]